MVDEIKKVLAAAAEKIGGRLATDDEMKEITERAEKTFIEMQAEMDKPDYAARLALQKSKWYAAASARTMTLETLPGFLHELAEAPHDYNSIGYAVAAAALAAAHALDRSPNGGITGFQAGFVFWEFYAEWLHERGKPARLVKYDEMLFPQYEEHFDKTIPKHTWEWLQKEAARHLTDDPNSHPDVVAHWRSIVEGRVPFGFKVKE